MKLDSFLILMFKLNKFGCYLPERNFRFLLSKVTAVLFYQPSVIVAKKKSDSNAAFAIADLFLRCI